MNANPTDIVKNEFKFLCKLYVSDQDLEDVYNIFLRKLLLPQNTPIPTIENLENEIQIKMKTKKASDGDLKRMKECVSHIKKHNSTDSAKLIYFLKLMSKYFEQPNMFAQPLRTDTQRSLQTDVFTSTPVDRGNYLLPNTFHRTEISSINSDRSSVTLGAQSHKFVNPHTPFLESQRNNASSSGIFPSNTPLRSSHNYQISNELSEYTVIGEMLFLILGCDGVYLGWNEILQQLVIKGGAILPFYMHWHVIKLCQCGSAYKKIRAYVEHSISNLTTGVVYQGLCVALNEHLGSYVNLVATLQSQYNAWTAEIQGRACSTNNQNRFTLEILLLKLHEPIEILYFLVDIINSAGDLRGGELASVIYKHLHHGSPDKVKLTRYLLLQAVEPFYHFIQQWIYDGILEESHQEFFVAISTKYDFNMSWTEKYGLRTQMIPNFITESEAQKILLTGKSINFLREVCGDKTMLKQKKEIAATMIVTAESMINQMVDRRFENMIQSVYQVTSKHLLDVMYKKYFLKDHFTALRKYMLHGQGDFIIRLIEIIGQELAKPADILKPNHLEGSLSMAIKSTNAQYDSQDIIDRVQIKFMRVADNEIGWDTFTLNYQINDIRPLHAVVNHVSFKCYLRTFNMLFRSRRAHFILNNCFKERNSSHRAFKQLTEVKSILYLSHSMVTQMLHFVNQIQIYINFEVLESSWKQFMESISKAVDLDTVMQYHEFFLKQVTNGCLLESENRDLLSTLRTIYDLIIQFEEILNDMLSKFHEELRLRTIFKEQIALSKQQGKWGLDDKKEKKEKERMIHFTNTDILKFRNKLKAHKNQYESILVKFLSTIVDHKYSSLRSLYADLDFNDVYRDRIREYRRNNQRT